MNDLVATVRAISQNIVDERTKHKILGAAMEELGELATEVNIDSGFISKAPSDDGVIGESIDVIICALDMIFHENPDITNEEICDIAYSKCTKWRMSVEARQQ